MSPRHPATPKFWADGTPRSVVLESPRHPTDPNLWRDGTKRSRGSVFDLDLVGYQPVIDVSRLTRLANQRKESTRRVEAARAAGVQIGTIHGLSRKADKRREES